MSRFGDALKALGGKDMAKKEEIVPPKPPEPKTKVQDVELTKEDSGSQEEVDPLLEALQEVNFISPQDVANLPEVELRALEINLLAAILKQLHS